MNEPGIPVDFDDCNDASTVIRADMPEMVLDGRLGEICQTRLVRFPIAYSWVSLATAAGALITRGNSALRPNLFSCVVGPKGSGKSQAWETSLQTLGMWPTHQQLLKAKFGSAEGLFDNLQDIEPDAVRLVYV